MNSYSIQNILVPVDLSETSLNAIETAVALAKKHTASLHLFYVQETNSAHLELAQDPYSSTSVNADVLSAIASAIRHRHEVVPNLIEVEGNVTDCIIKAGAQLPADLIVMGSHGASGYRNGFIGTNAYNAVKHATCPVLIIPPGRKITSFRKVVFPIRPVSGALSDHSSLDRFLSAKATVDVVGFPYQSDGESNVINKLIAEVKQKSGWVDVKAHGFWAAAANIPEAVLQHTAKVNADLLVLTTLLDAIAKPHYIGPHAQKILHSARVPLLSIKKIGVPSFA